MHEEKIRMLRIQIADYQRTATQCHQEADGYRKAACTGFARECMEAAEKAERHVRELSRQLDLLVEEDRNGKPLPFWRKFPIP